ncbi:MAG TPA: aspartate/glutamate racemase family protein [Acetobacteraceae bacterium]|nr:aspartate/glutamate racemase family protein [Acetobacteraceae bacterium]
MPDDAPAIARYRSRVPFRTDRGVAYRARIGLVALATDETIEYEWRRMLGLPGVGLFESRIHNARQITPETLRAMEGGIAAGAEVILPGQALDAMAFGCTSATIVLGEETIFTRLRQGRPDLPCTTPPTAALAALARLGTRRVAILTPYRDDVNEAVAAYFQGRGLEIVAFGSFSEDDDSVVARTDAESIRAAVLDLGRAAEVEAVFVSCTSLRLAEQAASIEAALGKPVTSSNHAMAWHALRLAGVADARPGFGRLFELGLAS